MGSSLSSTLLDIFWQAGTQRLTVCDRPRERDTCIQFVGHPLQVPLNRSCQMVQQQTLPPME